MRRLSQEDEERLIDAIIGEAVGEPFDGMVGVAAAAFNRVQAAPRSKTVDAVLRSSRFDGYTKPGAAAKRAKSDPAVREEARRALDAYRAGDYPQFARVTHFYNPSKANPSWARKIEDVGTVGNHRFMSEDRIAKRIGDAFAAIPAPVVPRANPLREQGPFPGAPGAIPGFAQASAMAAMPGAAPRTLLNNGAAPPTAAPTRTASVPSAASYPGAFGPGVLGAAMPQGDFITGDEPFALTAHPLGIAPFRETSPYGERKHPILGTNILHAGTDFARSLTVPSYDARGRERGFTGTPIRAAAPGEVTFVGNRSGYGKTVEITHADGYVTRYAHLSNQAVREGDRVAGGASVGRAGSTGRSTGPHLHFEVRDPEGNPLNPADYLPGAPQVPVPRANPLRDVRQSPPEDLLNQRGAIGQARINITGEVGGPASATGSGRAQISYPMGMPGPMASPSASVDYRMDAFNGRFSGQPAAPPAPRSATGVLPMGVPERELMYSDRAPRPEDRMRQGMTVGLSPDRLSVFMAPPSMPAPVPVEPRRVATQQITPATASRPDPSAMLAGLAGMSAAATAPRTPAPAAPPPAIGPLAANIPAPAPRPSYTPPTAIPSPRPPTTPTAPPPTVQGPAELVPAQPAAPAASPPRTGLSGLMQGRVGDAIKGGATGMMIGGPLGAAAGIGIGSTLGRPATIGAALGGVLGGWPGAAVGALGGHVVGRMVNPRAPQTMAPPAYEGRGGVGAGGAPVGFSFSDGGAGGAPVGFSFSDGGAYTGGYIDQFRGRIDEAGNRTFIDPTTRQPMNPNYMGPSPANETRGASSIVSLISSLFR